jgi:hypothetical protein
VLALVVWPFNVGTVPYDEYLAEGLTQHLGLSSHVVNYGERPTLLTKSANLGSERVESNLGSIPKMPTRASRSPCRKGDHRIHGVALKFGPAIGRVESP